MKYVSPSLTIPEVIEKCASLETDQEKIQFLSMYAKRKDFIWVVRMMYDTDLSNVKYDNNVKNYDESTRPVGFNYGKISNYVQKLEFILELYNKGETESANTKLRLVLESVSAQEAEFIYNLFLGRKTGVSKVIYKKIWPFLFQE